MVIGVVLLYKTSPVRFFSIDLYRRINDHLFLTFRNAPRTNTDIIILNISELPQEKIVPLVDILLTYTPKIIGINLCHLKKIDTSQFEKYSENSSIIIANCNEDFENSLSRKIESRNKVTHFKSNRSDYYEFRLLEDIDIIKTRNNKTERINFIGSCSNGSFFCHNLVSLDNLTLDIMDGKIILLGYVDSQYGEDIYSPNALRYYGTNSSYDGKAINIIKAMKGNPDKEITIYRAVPKSITEINNSDWITTTKEYAQDHMKGEKGWHVISKKVKAKDIASDGNSIHEFGYDPVLSTKDL